jgi:hypothetical protein
MMFMFAGHVIFRHNDEKIIITEYLYLYALLLAHVQGATRIQKIDMILEYSSR